LRQEQTSEEEVPNPEVLGPRPGGLYWRHPIFLKPPKSAPPAHNFSSLGQLNFEGAKEASDLLGNFSAINLEYEKDRTSFGFDPNDKNLMFLFPVYLTSEQLTKALMHFGELVFLARELQAVLVVPEVQNSKLVPKGLFSHTLCLYIDCENLGRHTPWITSAAYLERLQDEATVHKKGTLSELVITRSQQAPRCGPRSFSGFVKDKYEWINTLVYHRILHVQTLCRVREEISEDEVTRDLLDQVKGLYRVRHLMLFKTSPQLIFPHVIPYRATQAERVTAYHEFTLPSPYLLKSARRVIAEVLGGQPYVAIQWRLELRQAEDLGPCVDRVLQVVSRVREQTGVKALYLATDWVKKGPSFFQKSASCKEACEGEMVAREMGRLQKETGAVMLDDSPKLLPTKGRPTYAGMVDKLLSVEADWFVAIGEPCGRGTSTFLRSISQLRQDLGKSKRILFRGVVNGTGWEVV